MHKAARVILLTDDLVDIATKHHPHHAERFVVTPNGTNLPVDNPALRAEVERLSHLFNPDGKSPDFAVRRAHFHRERDL